MNNKSAFTVLSPTAVRSRSLSPQQQSMGHIVQKINGAIFHAQSNHNAIKNMQKKIDFLTSRIKFFEEQLKFFSLHQIELRKKHQEEHQEIENRLNRLEKHFLNEAARQIYQWKTYNNGRVKRF